MDFGKIFTSALRYALDAKRIGLIFVPAVIVILAAIGIVYSVSSSIPAVTATAALVSALGFVFAFILIAGIMLLISLYFQGVITTDSVVSQKKKTPLKKAFDAMKGRYLSLLGSVIIVGIISFLVSVAVGWIPIIGTIISIIVSWLFLLIIPSAVLGKNSAVDSVKESYNIFMQRKLDVFLFWLIAAIITGILLVVALIPLLIGAWPVVVSLISMAISGNVVITPLLLLIQQNIVGITIGAIIATVVFAYMTVFKTAATAYFYNEARKKKR